MNNKKLSVFLLLPLFFYTSYATAEDGFVKGKVELIRTHDATAQPNWIPPLFWFTLKGVSNAGACQKWNGKVLFASKDTQALNLITSAMETNKEIAVAYNQVQLVNGYCSSDYITIGNPAPLY
jgi:hypothetical protein